MPVRKRMRRLIVATVSIPLVLVVLAVMWLVMEQQEIQREEQARNLTIACQLDVLSLVKTLLDEGANPNARTGVPTPGLWERAMGLFKKPSNDFGTSALELAAGSTRSDQVFQLLLARGARIDARPDDLQKILSAAISGRNRRAVEWLLAPTNGQTFSSQAYDQALNAAVDARDANLVSLLLARGADPNRSRALTQALFSNNSTMAPLLLKHGAKLTPNDLTFLQRNQHRLAPALVALAKKR